MATGPMSEDIAMLCASVGMLVEDAGGVLIIPNADRHDGREVTLTTQYCLETNSIIITMSDGH